MGETVVGKALVTTSLLPSGEELEGGVSNSGIELEWSFTGRVRKRERERGQGIMGRGEGGAGVLFCSLENSSVTNGVARKSQERFSLCGVIQGVMESVGSAS